MKIADLIAWVEEWANPPWSEIWDHCGWQMELGVLQETARVLVCLIPILAVVHEAIALLSFSIAFNLIFSIYYAVDNLT